jgi:hypothetical protein
MFTGQAALNPKAYESEHISQVLADLTSGVEPYLDDFGRLRSRLGDRFHRPLTDFEKDHSGYKDIFAFAALEEYEYDPPSFKNVLAAKCPIIHNALYSQADFMQDYKAAFYAAQGSRLLEVTTNIVRFAHDYARDSGRNRSLAVQSPTDLNLSELDGERFTAYGVIGGGIRSHFLYQLFPAIFPNRSRSAIWALYFLVGRKNYDFNDESEFLMVERNGSGTQQNYYYPYDLFCYYAQHLSPILEEVCHDAGYSIDGSRRYVYLNTLLDFVAQEHESDIQALVPQHDQPYY